MKHKMNNNYSKVGDLNPQVKRLAFRHFFKTSIVLWMMAILIASPFLSYATFIVRWNDTCCVSKQFNNNKYSKLVRISTPDEADYMKADREIRKNLFRDILNEGKIKIKSFDESDFEIQTKFQKEFHIQLTVSNKSDNEIHQDFIISQLNWRFFEKESDDKLNNNFINEGTISVHQNYCDDADNNINANFFAQNIQIISKDQLVRSDMEINQASKLELNRTKQ